VMKCYDERVGGVAGGTGWAACEMRLEVERRGIYAEVFGVYGGL